MDFGVVSWIFLVFGLLVYAGIVFWSGTHSMWWLAVLVSLPALLGGLLSLLGDTSSSTSPLFRNFTWLAFGQIAFGAVVYWAGKVKRQSSGNSFKGFE